METFASTILNDLPERKRAWSLCEAYYRQFPIHSMPIQENELMQSYLSPMYNHCKDFRANQNCPLSSTTFRPHRCAVTFFIFAIATWLDVTNQQCTWLLAPSISSHSLIARIYRLGGSRPILPNWSVVSLYAVHILFT